MNSIICIYKYTYIHVFIYAYILYIYICVVIKHNKDNIQRFCGIFKMKFETF